jgi:hypothetical protein
MLTSGSGASHLIMLVSERPFRFDQAHFGTGGAASITP